MPRSTAATLTRKPLDLYEQIKGTTAAPLKVDRDQGIIYRVKVLGRHSKNNHGILEAENGTEYTDRAMRSELPLLEGAKVKNNHPPDRAKPAKERPTEDTLGVLRNVRLESDEHGEPALWADLHCLTSHTMWPRLVEDVEKGLGVFGLSHNAASSVERLDRGRKLLVIEEIATVRSVDLVDKPATNTNLWESERTVKTYTMRSLLESASSKWSQNRKSWVTWLLEDDAMAPAMDATMEAEDNSEPEDQLWAGFQSAITAVLDKYKSGDLDCDAACKQIKDWLKAHDKLTGTEEPEPVEESEDDDDGKKKDEMEAKCESLTRENKALRLCLLEGATKLTPVQLKSITLLESEAEQKEMLATFNNLTPLQKFKAAKSVTPGAIKPGKKPGEPGAKDRLESAEHETRETLSLLRAD